MSTNSAVRSKSSWQPDEPGWNAIAQSAPDSAARSCACRNRSCLTSLGIGFHVCIGLLLQACLLQNAPVGTFGQVLGELARDGHLARFGRVLELAMASLLGDLDPSILGQPSDHVPNLHAKPLTRHRLGCFLSFSRLRKIDSSGTAGRIARNDSTFTCSRSDGLRG